MKIETILTPAELPALVQQYLFHYMRTNCNSFCLIKICRSTFISLVKAEIANNQSCAGVSLLFQLHLF